MDVKMSIIVPVYKAESRLELCIESVLNQTYSNIELILIDDGSPDKSGEICEEYASRDKRVKVVHIPNGGVSNARNIGIQNATGEYITFVDSDDTLEKGTYQIALKYLEETGGDMIAYGMVFEYYEDVKIVHHQVKQIESALLLSRQEYKSKFFNLYETNYLSSCCNKIFKASILKDNNIKFNNNLVVYEDLEFVLRYLIYTNKIVAMPNILYHYYHVYGEKKLGSRRNTDYKRNIDILVHSLEKYVEYMGMSDIKDIARINGMIFRYYILFLQRVILEPMAYTNKRNHIKNIVTDEKLKKCLMNSCSNSIKIRILMSLFKIRAIDLIYISLKLN